MELLEPFALRDRPCLVKSVEEGTAIEAVRALERFSPSTFVEVRL